MSPERKQFQKVISKGVLDQRLVDTKLNQAETVLERLQPLIARYLDVWQSPTIPPRLLRDYLDASRRMIRYGFFMHALCFDSEARIRFRELDLDDLYRKWFAMFGPALSTFASYSRQNANVPEAVFVELYELEFAALVQSAGFWWWKRTRIQSAIRDQFATGVTLGMALDAATSRLR